MRDWFEKYIANSKMVRNELISKRDLFYIIKATNIGEPKAITEALIKEKLLFMHGKKYSLKSIDYIINSDSIDNQLIEFNDILYRWLVKHDSVTILDIHYLFKNIMKNDILLVDLIRHLKTISWIDYRSRRDIRFIPDNDVDMSEMNEWFSDIGSYMKGPHLDTSILDSINLYSNGITYSIDNLYSFIKKCNLDTIKVVGKYIEFNYVKEEIIAESVNDDIIAIKKDIVESIEKILVEDNIETLDDDDLEDFKLWASLQTDNITADTGLIYFEKANAYFEGELTKQQYLWAISKL